MISNELLNVMSVDELRNYANHASHLIGSMNELFYAKNELIGSLHRCFNDARFEAERDKEYQNRHTMLLELEDMLLKEHYDELYSISNGFFADGKMVCPVREEKRQRTGYTVTLMENGSRSAMKIMNHRCVSI